MNKLSKEALRAVLELTLTDATYNEDLDCMESVDGIKLFLDDVYKVYKVSEKPDKEFIESVKVRWEETSKEVKVLSNWSEIRSNVFLAYDTNMLSDIHQQFLKGYITIEIIYGDDAYVVSNKTLKEWGVSKEEVWVQAEINTYEMALTKDVGIKEPTYYVSGSGIIFIPKKIEELAKKLNTDQLIFIPIGGSGYIVKENKGCLKDILNMHKRICADKDKQFLIVYNGEELTVLE